MTLALFFFLAKIHKRVTTVFIFLKQLYNSSAVLQKLDIFDICKCMISSSIVSFFIGSYVLLDWAEKNEFWIMEF